MVFCTECGKENPNESLYCYNCGARLIHDNVVGDINRQTHDNKNVNYQNGEYFEKPLIKKDETQKGSKHLLISILDAITNISVYLLIMIPIGIVILFFIDYPLFYSTFGILIGSIFLFIVIGYVSSVISDKLKGRLRQKIMKTGVSAQARILEVRNLEYNHVDGIRTAELLLKVNPYTDASYHAKSTVKVGVSDASLILRPGTTVQVFIDPEDASQVEVKY